MRRKTHEEFIEQLNKVQGEGEYMPLENYKGANTKILVRHTKCGYDWNTTPNRLLLGNGCPKCNRKNAILGINTIWDTDRWMVDLGVSEEDAKRYTNNSNQKITVKCYDCGKEKEIVISNIYKRRSISCSCGDGKSYPEKFIFSLLEQLNVDFEIEYSPKWIGKKRYDFHIKDNDCIIETHGEQHYDKGFDRIGGRTLEREQINDKFKKEMALNNGIKHYIELDCRESNMDYIKNSILNSELANLFDLSKIDWLQCAEFANKNIVKEVCNYWDNKGEDETTTDLGKVFNLNVMTIRNYLKRGTKLGWCDYDPKEEMKKIGKQNSMLSSKKVEIFKDGKSLGFFESCTEIQRQSEELFGVRLNYSKISSACRGERRSHKGFTFKYIEEDNNLNINKIA